MSISSRRKTHIAIMAIVLGGMTLLIFNTKFFRTIDYQWFDWQLAQRATSLRADEQIVVIDIDDDSIAAMNHLVGRWSWPRSVFAEVFEQLQNYDPQAVVVDILFAEKDLYRPDDDDYFREVVEQMPNVFFASLQLKGEDKGGVLLKKLSKHTAIQATPMADHNARAYFVLPNVVEVNANQVGIINAVPDVDEVVRRHKLFNQYSGWQIKSLPHVVANYLLFQEHNNKAMEEIILSWPTGGQRPYPTKSFADVYRAIIENDEQYLQQFTHSIILIGASAAGLFDAHNTPIHSELPGVYLLAVALDNLVNNRFITTADQTTFNVFFVLVFLLLHLVFAYFDSYAKQVVLGTLIFIIATLSAFVWAYWSLTQLQLLLVVTPILCWLSVLIILAVVNGYAEYSQRQYALAVFGRFLDPIMVSSLYEEGKLEISQLNKKTKVTVMFSDIRNFTQLSEQAHADDVLNLLNSYFANQVRVIFQHYGTLDKFIGDCIMAFWGAPNTDELQEIHAIQTAIVMSTFIDEFSQTLPEHLRTFDIGIGIHTGEAIVGLVGTDLRVDYTVIGDAVNVASRIEGLTKGTSRILVSKETMMAASSMFLFEFVGKFDVKGRTNQVELYRPMGRKK